MKRYITIILIALTCLGVQGCSHFDDMNKNPYASNDVAPESFIQTITFATQSKILSTSYSLTSQLVQHSMSVSTSETTVLVYNYECSNSQSSTFWELYAQKGNAESMLMEARKDAEEARKTIELAQQMDDSSLLKTAQTSEKVAKGLEGVALVLRTYVMQILTDVYGDVPYLQAGLMPVDPENVEFNVTYDSQKDIYRDMLLSLEKANKLLKDASNFNAALDNTYGGDVKSWRKLCNTLYLRLLMRVSLKLKAESSGMIDLGEEFGQLDVINKIAEIYDGYSKGTNGNYPIFQSVDDRALVHYNSLISTYYTPFYTTTNTLFKQYAACQTIVDKMVKTDAAGKRIIDPRYLFYFDDAYLKGVGLPVQWTLEQLGDYIDGKTIIHYSLGGSSYGGSLKNASSYTFMSYSEALFIFAEACCRGWIPGGVSKTKELYLAACEASMTEWNPKDLYKDNILPRDEYLAHLSSEFLDSMEQEEQLQLIMWQKWIASYWYGVEAWSDYRRTGYPILKTNGPAAQNDGILCTRMRYPYTEPHQNGKCYWEAVNGWLNGSDNMQTDVWFADTQKSKENRMKGRQSN